MKVKLPFLATFLFSLQTFVGRLFFIPSSYIVPYIYFCNPAISYISLFYISYAAYSIIITSNIVSTIIYSFLFILNTFVYNSIKNTNQETTIKIEVFNTILRNVLILLSIFSLLLWVLNINILPNKIYLTLFNPLNGLNINSYIFIIYYYSFASYYLRKNNDFYFGSVLLLITESRTALVFLFFLLMQYLNDKKLLPSVKTKTIVQINIKIIIPTLLIIFTLTPIYFGTNYLKNISNNIETSYEFAINILGRRNEIKKLARSGAQIQDNQRVCLTFNNIDHISKTFPVGTGIGIKSYINSLKKHNLGCKHHINNDRVYIRAHNFYISYLAEMGIFFVPLLIFLLKHVFNKGSRFIIIGLLIGFLGHEYLTSPWVWLILGLNERKNHA